MDCDTYGDVRVFKSIDRLGRNYTEILEQWAAITKNREADIALQLLSYVAQTERENIRQRQAEGIAAAKGRGVRFGRERLQMPENFSAYAQLWQDGGISSRCAARGLAVPAPP